MPERTAEFFQLEGRRRQDAKLHEPILAGGDEQAAHAVSRKVAKRLGLTDAEDAALMNAKPQALKAFDPSQPRDEQGRWTDGGGDGGGAAAPSGEKPPVPSPAPKLPGAKDVPPYSGRREGDTLNGAKIYDNREDPSYFAEHPKLRDVDQLTTVLSNRTSAKGEYYVRQWAIPNEKGEPVQSVRTDTAGRIHVSDISMGLTHSPDPHQETVSLRAPSPAPGGDKLLLVSERPNDEKLDRWQKEIDARQKEIENQGQAGNREDEHLSRMVTALNAYRQESEESLNADRSGVNTIYDGDGHLLAAGFTYVDEAKKTAVIQYHGATDPDAQKKMLEQVTNKFGDKVSAIQLEEWADDKDSISTILSAGFRQHIPVGETTGPRLTFVKRDIPGAKIFTAAHSALILGAAKATARLSGYDPDLVDTNDGVYEFKIGGRSGYKAAGLAHLDTGRIELFPAQISTADGAIGVTVHEVAHQKYQTVLNARNAEWKRIMVDPETTGPNGMRPDGSLPPALAEKYPIYSRFVKHDNTTVERVKSDGITAYSKEYWQEYTPGHKVTRESADHETIAEMARVEQMPGFQSFDKVPVAKEWVDYYRDIMRTYDELRKPKA